MRTTLHRVAVWFEDKTEALGFAQQNANVGRRVGVVYNAHPPVRQRARNKPACRECGRFLPRKAA